MSETKKTSDKRGFVALTVFALISLLLLSGFAGLASAATVASTSANGCNSKEFMQIGDSLTLGNKRIVLTTISGMPYGTTYSTSASFDLFESSTSDLTSAGSKIDSFTLQEGGNYNQNGVLVRLKKAFLGTGGSAYAQVELCSGISVTTPTPNSTVPPGCETSIEFMQIGEYVIHQPSDYKIVLTDISGTPYGTTYTPSASFDVFDASGRKIRTATLKRGQEYNNEDSTAQLRFGVINAFVGTGGSAYAYAYFCPSALLPTVTVMPTPTVSPSPIPGSCSAMTNVLVSQGQTITSCGFTVKILTYRSASDYGKVDFEVNGMRKLSAAWYMNTYTTTEGGPAIYLRFNRVGGVATGFDDIIPYEKYFRALRVGQSFRLADGTSVTLRSIAQGTDGAGSATFDVAGITSTGSSSVTISTNQEKQVSARSFAHVYAVRLNGDVFVGLTPSVDTPLSPGAVSSVANGFNIGIVGSGDFVPPASDTNQGTLYRQPRSCDNDAAIGDPQAIPLNSGYGNIVCSSRKQEQCYGDGSFDAYYDEYCTGSGSKNVPESVKNTKTNQKTNQIQDFVNAILQTQKSDDDSENPPLPPSETGVEGNQFEVKLNAGWNLVSTPLTGSQSTGLFSTAQGGKIVKTDCAASTLWNFGASGAYETPGKIVEGTILSEMKGYWAYVRNDCSFLVEGSTAVNVGGTTLHAGWNEIGGSLHPVSFNSVSRSCNVVSGPWYYNSAARKYVKAGALQPGNAYFVKVAGECVLDATDLSVENPPALPQEQETSSAVSGVSAAHSNSDANAPGKSGGAGAISKSTKNEAED